MEKSFRLESIKVLQSLGAFLIPIESYILNTLEMAIHADSYFDTLFRMSGNIEHFELILENIWVKAEAHGLFPALIDIYRRTHPHQDAAQ